MRGCLVWLTLVVCLPALTAVPASGQVRDLLEQLLGDDEGGSIDDVETLSNDGTTLVLRVRYSDVETPGEVVLTARMLDFRLRALPGFEVEPVALLDPEGETDLTVVFASGESVKSASVEVRLEKNGDSVAKELHPLVYAWQSGASALDAVADALTKSEADEPQAQSDQGGADPGGPPVSGPPPPVVIDPVPLADTPDPGIAETTSSGAAAAEGGGAAGRRTGSGRSIEGSGRIPSAIARGNGSLTVGRPATSSQPHDIPERVSPLPGTATGVISRPTKALLRGLWSLGYLWANDQSSEGYTPSNTYAYNTAGGAMKISRAETGSYILHFDQLGAGSSNSSNLQVTAYGGDRTRCQAVRWNAASTGFRGSVQCTDMAGKAVDSRFMGLAALSLGNSRLGYVLTDSTASKIYLVDGKFVANPGGSAVAVTRQSPGTFEVRFPGLAAGGEDQGNVQVTSCGKAGEYCNLYGAETVGGQVTARVRCFSAAGQLQDSRFSVLALVASSGAPGIGYTRGLNAAPEVTFGPGAVEVKRTGIGVYSFTFAGLGGPRGGTVQVTALGSDPNWCLVTGWEGGATSFMAGVRCYRPDGQQADSYPSVLVLR